MVKLAASKWFHAIVFEGAVSPGRFAAGRPQNYTLFGAMRFLERINVRGRTCCDIGTMDGLISFILKQEGAGTVVATDIEPRPTFEEARKQLGLDIDYVTPLTINQLGTRFPAGHFDLMVCAGVLYHVFDPLSMLVNLRSSIKADGLLILETQYLYRESGSLVEFAPGETGGDSIHANTFFKPSYRALRAMMEITGFEVLASIAVGGRLTLLARAERPTAISASTAMVRKVLDRYRSYRNYKEVVFHDSWDRPDERSSIVYEGPRGDFCINTSRFSTRFALQPQYRAYGASGLQVRLRDLVHRLKTSWGRRGHLRSCDHDF